MKYKFGDIRKTDGKVFVCYYKNRNNFEYWVTSEQFEERKRKNKLRDDARVSTKFGHLKELARKRKRLAEQSKIPFLVSNEYLLSIAPDFCPILGMKLSWGERKGVISDNSPSLDKIKPELGYIEGNVAWMSNRANMLKNNATPEELRAIANWIETQ